MLHPDFTASTERRRLLLHDPETPLRLIHTSDVHLESDTFGSGPRGDEYRERVRGAFRSVIELANRSSADLLLIVGDLFDSARVSPEALNFALGTIARAQMPVVMIPGNHDAHDERSIYGGIEPGNLPTNLKLILEPQGQMVEFPALSTRVWGRALVEHSPEYKPLSGLPCPVKGYWNIGMAHGFHTEDGGTYRSSPITAEEIADSGYHYIALGHIHLFGDVSSGATRAFYCGTPAPLYAGSENGFVAEVTCAPSEPVNVKQLAIGSSV